MAKVVVLVCDECESQDGVKHYEIRQGVRRAGTDLCEEHSKPLEVLLAKAAKSPQKARATRTRHPKVTSMEEIEKLKKS